MAEQFEKFPCYNRFPRDWIAGTATMTLEERGAFNDLLEYSWEQTPPCTLPGEDRELALLLRITPSKWRAIKAVVLRKFERLPDGRIRNPKLYSVYCEMVEHRQKRRKAAEKGNEARWGIANGSQCDPNALAKGSPPTPTPSLKEKTDGAHAPERLGAVVARIIPAVNQ